MSKIERYIGYSLWGLTLFDVILAIVLAEWQIAPDDIGVALLVVSWLFITLVIAGMGLMIVYRRSLMPNRVLIYNFSGTTSTLQGEIQLYPGTRFGLRRWGAWLGLIALFIVGALVYEGTLHPADAHLSLLAALLFPFSGAALLTAVILLLYRHDIGARLIAVLSLVGIWGLLISMRSLGNFIEAMFQFLQTGKPTIIWWSAIFFLMSICLIPLIALSFAWHTALLIWRERRACLRIE